MANIKATPANGDLADINRRRLFLGSCLALIATAVAFATVGAILLALKRDFILTNAEVGWIGGAALWGFAVSQLIFAPLCDTLGMRFLLRGAFLCHIAGTVIMIVSTGFWGLFFGALIIALGNGLVEAACNPLVATLYPDNKTVRLNQFHVWFPGGIVIGAVAAFLLDLVGIGAWEIKLALILIPTAIYGVMMLTQTFPQTENVQAGVSMGQMFKVTFTTPLFLLLLFCMAITASTELGPGRWIPAVLEAGGIAGILVLAWINGIMAVLRYKAGPVVHRLSPTGILFACAVLSAIGLFWFSYAETTVVAFLSATVFAVGVSYFWPTMLGTVAERVPRSGALGLGLMGAMGMAFVGLVTSPQMGAIADEYAHQHLDTEQQEQVVALMEDVTSTYPALSPSEEAFQNEISRAEQAAQEVLSAAEVGSLPQPETANALRTIIDSGTAVGATGDEQAQGLVGTAGALLGPADNYGGRIAFRYIVPFTALLILIFGALYFNDKRKGGYKAEKLTEGEMEEAQREAKATA